MKTEEIIEVLQAYEEGKELELEQLGEWDIHVFTGISSLLFMLSRGYEIRVKPEPKIEKVWRYTSFDAGGVFRSPSLYRFEIDTHCITYNLVDGEPDLESFKIEKL